MKLIGLIQVKNEGIGNLRAILKQAEVMSDGVVILDDNSTDDSFPDEIKKHPLVLEYYRIPFNKEFYEGINMSILMNMARRNKADWCYFPSGHYRYAGALDKFKELISKYDEEGYTHINLRWFTYWDDKRVRIDNKWYPPHRFSTNIFKLKGDTNFKLLQAHTTHAASIIEVHKIMDDVINLNYGRNTPEKRQKKYDFYKGMGGLHPLDYEAIEAYIEEVPEEHLKELTHEELINLTRSLNNRFLSEWLIFNGERYIPERYLRKIEVKQ